MPRHRARHWAPALLVVAAVAGCGGETTPRPDVRVSVDGGRFDDFSGVVVLPPTRAATVVLAGRVRPPGTALTVQLGRQGQVPGDIDSDVINFGARRQVPVSGLRFRVAVPVFGDDEEHPDGTNEFRLQGSRSGYGDDVVILRITRR